MSTRSGEQEGEEGTGAGPEVQVRFGEYQLLRRLGGRDAPAQGWLERHLAKRGSAGEGQLFVVKRLRGALLASPARLATALTTTRRAAALNSPATETIAEVGVVDGQPFIAAAYTPGERLADALAVCNRGLLTFPLRAALVVAKEVAAALEAAHGPGATGGITHGAATPEHVLVGYDGSVQLLDFGLAALPDEAGASAATARAREVAAVCQWLAALAWPDAGTHDAAALREAHSDQPEPVAAHIAAALQTTLGRFADAPKASNAGPESPADAWLDAAPLAKTVAGKTTIGTVSAPSGSVTAGELRGALEQALGAWGARNAADERAAVAAALLAIFGGEARERRLNPPVTESWEHDAETVLFQVSPGLLVDEPARSPLSLGPGVPQPISFEITRRTDESLALPPLAAATPAPPAPEERPRVVLGGREAAVPHFDAAPTVVAPLPAMGEVAAPVPTPVPARRSRPTPNPSGEFALAFAGTGSHALGDLHDDRTDPRLVLAAAGQRRRAALLIAGGALLALGFALLLPRRSSPRAPAVSPTHARAISQPAPPPPAPEPARATSPLPPQPVTAVAAPTPPSTTAPRTLPRVAAKALPTVSPRTAADDSTGPREAAATVLTRSRRPVLACFDQHRTSLKEASGVLTLRVVLDPDGALNLAQASPDVGPGLFSCISDVLSRQRVRRPPPETTAVEVPFAFSVSADEPSVRNDAGTAR